VAYLHDFIEILLSTFHSFATSLNLSHVLKSYTITINYLPCVWETL